MTAITREQFLTIAGCESSSELAQKLEQIGIIIADPEPPAAMVMKAQAICYNVAHPHEAALAALQYAERAVRDAPVIQPPARLSGGPLVDRNYILTTIGAKP